MPSLNDIPLELRIPEAKNRFITWLQFLKVEPYIKRELIAKWILVTKYHFNNKDYHDAGVI